MTNNGQKPVELVEQIVFEAPGKDAPGFLRRQYLALNFRDAFTTGKATGETVKEMVEFMLAYIKEPADKEHIERLLWEASETQIMTMLDAITGTTADDQAELKKSDSSPNGG